MALVLKDRVKESSTSSGTGNITLAGAYTGYQTFASAIASGSTVYYTIHNTTSPNDGEWEVGVGTFTSPSTLSRDTVLSSSNSGNLVSFSTASTLEVFITQPAEEAVYINQATGLVEAFGNGTNTISFTDINTANLTANTVTLTAGTISTNAANATDIVNKQYVDGIVAAGVHYHEPVLVESPTALVAVYNQPNGAGNGVGATLTNSGSNVALIIDGVSVSNTARVLVYQQSNAVQNGVYTVTNPGAPDTPGPGAQWVLTRATDADSYVIDSPTGLSEGSTFFVQSGDTGAGETYTCNTTGVITFGSTNITFSQISSAQIYSAGTGLSLTNTTFSIANTAVTAATYGNAGEVAQFTVNAQGQITNAANVSINASSITVGTLANTRTTASDANGASTIVARDANGSFTANVITATDVNSTNVTATTGSFTNISGNAAAVTAINASNISSGTIANARTTGSTSNSASTLVLRDANGNFGSNVITASSFSGDGTAITAINASNISSGTIANARTTASSANGASTIVQRDSGGNFSANTVTAAVIGDISGGSAINASNISSGTIANARTTASSSNGASTIVLRGASGEFAAGAITAASFSGNGSAITAINASAITTGTLDNARTTASSANGASTIVSRDANGSFSANTVTATTFNGAHSGNGASLTDINASNITSGTISNARTTAASANGASTIVARDASGNFTANIITANGSALSAINASNVSSGTLAVARGGTGTGTAFTTGSVVFSGASGVYTQDNAQLFWDDSNNRLGVGTATPGAKLTVSDGSPSIYLTATTTTGTTIGNKNNRLVLLSDSVTSGAGGEIVFAATDTDVDRWGAISGNITNNGVDGAQGTILFATKALNNATTLTARMAIFASGGVSIGNTTDPGATNLSVTGTIAGNGAPLTGINASNIASGTIANARTTAATANGASTIVLRDANGSFAGNVITGTTGTFTSVSGNGVALTAINASNITSGTIANARTTASNANGASTIVSRDANGSFTANIITANGSAISAINGSNVTTGTVANARTTAASANGASTIVSRDANGSFVAGSGTFNTNLLVGAGTAIDPSSVTAFGAGLITEPSTSFSAHGIAFGGSAGQHGAIVYGSNIMYFGTETGTDNTMNTRATLSSTGVFNATGGFSGSGAAISAINASNLSSGTVATARLASGTANSSTYLRGDQTWATITSGTVIPAGTRMLFAQTAAPTGFTKDTTNYNNHALRVVTGTASTGGTVDFTTAFASQTPTGTVSISAINASVGSTTLATSQIPSHNHRSLLAYVGQYGDAGPGNAGTYVNYGGKGDSDFSGPAGGGGSHNHSFSFSSGTASFSGSAINLAVKYLDVITATKD